MENERERDHERICWCKSDTEITRVDSNRDNCSLRMGERNDKKEIETTTTKNMVEYSTTRKVQSKNYWTHVPKVKCLAIIVP